MSHGPHEEIQGKEGALLYDGCDECDHRAEAGLEGLLHFDPTRFSDMWRRMVAVEHAAIGVDESYRSENEAKLGRVLYHVALLMERNIGIDPWQWPPHQSVLPVRFD